MAERWKIEARIECACLLKIDNDHQDLHMRPSFLLFVYDGTGNIKSFDEILRR